jgi:pseudaminic acid synthase
MFSAPAHSWSRGGALRFEQEWNLVDSHIQIGKRRIGPGEPVYVIAELSANHNQDFDQAVRILQTAKEGGADAVKLQTYTADTITIRSDRSEFRIGGGTLWDGRTLHDLYGEAYTPWEWQPKLKKVAGELGLDLFSSPFDETAVDFLEGMGVPAYKVASFELVDIPLIRKMARSGKPLLMSTGMATLEEINEAVQAAGQAGARQIALLKCTSAYPASADEMNLRTIPELARRFEVPIGLSDHTLGMEVPIAAVALGACIIEKHLTISRSQKGPDNEFSLEPHEFKTMVNSVRATQSALGGIHFGASPHEMSSRIFRRSLFVVEQVKQGEEFTLRNVRSIRPGHGMHTRHLSEVLGKRAACDIERGTPLEWSLVAKSHITSQAPGKDKR